MFGFARIIQFFAHTLADFPRRILRIDGRAELPMQGKQGFELIEISLNGRGHIGIL